MLKKFFITVIIILIMTQFIPFLHDRIYGEEPVHYNSMPGDNVIGIDPNGGLITKPADSGAVANLAEKEQLHRFIILTLIIVAILSIVFVALYKLKIFDQKLDLFWVIAIIFSSIAMVGMAVSQGVIISY